MRVKTATIIVVLLMSCGLGLNGEGRGSRLLPEEYADSVRARYGVSLSVPEGFSVDVFSEATIWSLAENCKYGNPMLGFYAGLISEDRDCMILLESVPAYSEKRISGELKNNTGNMCRELSYILSDGESGFRATSKVEDYSDSVIEYGRAKSRRLFGADKVYSYSVPRGKTAFCYIHPSVDEEVPKMQSLFQNEYPEMRRWFFIKDGHLTYSLTMMLSPEGAGHERKYTKMLRNIVRLVADNSLSVN